MIELLFVLTLIIGLVYTGRISGILVSWQQTPSWHLQKIHVPQHSVAILLAARNEEKHIEACIKSVLRSADHVNRLFPNHHIDVWIGNDHSTDKTLEVASDLIDDRLTVVDMPTEIEGKKAALAHLAQLTTADYLLFTDADCIVAETWIATLSTYVDRSRAVAITGPVSTGQSYRWIDHWQYLDIIGMMAITAHGLYRSTFTLANGANMLVKRSAYVEAIDRVAGSQYASGDDVFVMQYLRSQYGDAVRYCKAKGAIVHASTEPSWRSLWQQRKRWASKTKGYQERGVVRLQSFAWLYSVLVIVGLLLAPWTGGVSVFCSLLLFLIKATIDYMLLSQLADFFDYRRPLKVYPFVALTHLLYIIVAGLAALLPVRYTWKGRKTV